MKTQYLIRRVSDNKDLYVIYINGANTEIEDTLKMCSALVFVKIQPKDKVVIQHTIEDVAENKQKFNFFEFLKFYWKSLKEDKDE